MTHDFRYPDAICEDGTVRPFHRGNRSRHGYVYASGARVYGVVTETYEKDIGFRRIFTASPGSKHAWLQQPAPSFSNDREYSGGAV